MEEKSSGEISYRIDSANGSHKFSSLAATRNDLNTLFTLDSQFAAQNAHMLELIRRAALASSLYHKRRSGSIHGYGAAVSSMISEKLTGMLLTSEAGARMSQKQMRVIENRLTSLCLRYFKVVQGENGALARKLRYEDALCARDLSASKLSTSLALFCLHIEQETRGSVVVKKLSHTHPQYLRCQRAASENVKKNFFAGDESRYDGVTVVDVFKIENR
jgi:hypothetical protein